MPGPTVVEKGQLTLQAFLSSRKRKRPADAQLQGEVEYPKCGAELLVALLQTVPRLRSALAELDSLRQLPCAARDIASLAVALGLRTSKAVAAMASDCGGGGVSSACARGSDGLVEELWFELEQSGCHSMPAKYVVPGRRRILSRSLLALHEACEAWALTEKELQAIPSSTCIAAQHVCGAPPSCHVVVEEPVYTKLDLLLAAYRKWVTPEALVRGQRQAAWKAADARGERQALLRKRLRQESLDGLGTNLQLIRDYINFGTAPLDTVIEVLRVEHQRRERLRLLRARLAKEGLADTSTQCGLCRKFLKGAMELEEVVQVLLAERRAKERLAELRTRLESEGLQDYMTKGVCQRHLSDPSSSLDHVIATITALHARLEAEGLDVSQYTSTHLCQWHLMYPECPGLDLDSMIQAFSESRRNRELWHKLVELRMPYHIQQRCCQQYIARGEPSLEAVLEHLGTLPVPLGGAKPANKCVAYACSQPIEHEELRCSSRCCADHCQDVLCDLHSFLLVCKRVPLSGKVVELAK